MASIDFVCRADHAADATHPRSPTITLHEDLWAYCLRGGDEHHTWVRVPSTTVARIQIEMVSHHIILIPEVKAKLAAIAGARKQRPSQTATARHDEAKKEARS